MTDRAQRHGMAQNDSPEKIYLPPKFTEVYSVMLAMP
ncbi:MAG: hypothetical protein BWY25_01511 [Chloroflexi bacterium ADurb.Bin222]|nr:MAG: hypothetical protein BWY25_01511 [Chloroflexi bacterium ADurb.Bin222]